MQKGKIPGAEKRGTAWYIPDDAVKPADGRVRSGRYLKGKAYDFIHLCCEACRVEFALEQADVEAMPHGDTALSIYTDNDIETYRDVLYYVGQVLGGFFCINREGVLELRKYGDDTVMEIAGRHRFSVSVK